MKPLSIFLLMVFAINALGQNNLTLVYSNSYSCGDPATGIITITASGGQKPYQYSNNGGKTFQTSNIFNNLKQATYPLRIRDSSGRSSEVVSDTLTVPIKLSIFCSDTSVKCNGDATGSVSVFASGGKPPYLYSWSNGSTKPNQNGLPANIYTVIVTDKNQCRDTCKTTITEPKKLVAVAQSSNPTCANNDGKMWVDSSVDIGGTPPYNYLWIKDSTTIIGRNMVQSGLPAGTYSLTVTDANGCKSVSSVLLSQQGSPKPKYAIGDSMSCGLVFYVDHKVDSTRSCYTHYLVCAFKDQNTSIAWYKGTYNTKNANSDILFDKANADKIDSISAAATICAQYTTRDSICTGWYLPSKTELDSMYKNLAIKKIGGFAKEGYWSSVEGSKVRNAWIVDFFNGRIIQNDKANKYHVRAVCEIWIKNDQ